MNFLTSRPIQDSNIATQLEAGGLLEQINRDKCNQRKFAMDNFVVFNPLIQFLFAVVILKRIEFYIHEWKRIHWDYFY